MECYLREINARTEGCIQNIIVRDLISRIEDLAHDHGSHVCQSFVQQRFCRYALVAYFHEAYRNLQSELGDSRAWSHYETMLCAELTNEGFSHEMAVRYASMDRIRNYVNSGFVEVFDRMWGEHPEVISNNERSVEVEIAVDDGQTGDADVVIIE